MTSPYGKGPKGKATELHAKITRARGHCERCGATGVRLECAHIIGRRYSHTRTDLANSFCLCNKCHEWFHDHPPDFTEFVYEHLGKDEYEELNRKSQSTAKVDWYDEVERLKEIWSVIEVST